MNDERTRAAARDHAASRLVEKLTAGSQDQVRNFKKSLAALRRRKFVTCRESGAFANELADLLARLDAEVQDPRRGMEMIAAFYRSDAMIFERCDDSNGSIGDVFRIDARDRFSDFAQRCDDKSWIVDLLFELLQEDDYGVRDSVLDGAARYLPRDALRALAHRMWEAAGPAVAPVESRDERDHSRRHWLLLVELVARQAKDPDLFERAQRAMSPKLGTAACIEIAEIRLEAGEPEVALDWLLRVDQREAFMAEERDRLLRTVYRDLGHQEELERLMLRRFRSNRNRDMLEALLEVVGHENRDVVVAEAADVIQKNDSFSLNDVRFLSDCVGMQDAAEYVVRHRADIDGEHWYGLHPLAERMRDAGHSLAATVLYRALLDSILDRGQSRTYGHGVRHLRQLDRLSVDVRDWEGVSVHAEYLARIRERHGRKKSFWTRYDRA